MRLLAIDMVGFKSFAEPTTIAFDTGVTAIVGPNGSGKSNVTDAIRWVLGEQKTSELRATRMVDVVFSGTQTKRALGVAEVTLTFDNSDGTLAIDYTEVAVTRRYYRSGESEYEINRTPCRLKDIQTLFMDTGLGREGYAIVGQGKVEQLLSTQRDDRRQAFDEASGIVKFKTRKAEALRKLEASDHNLQRLNDIIGELSARLSPLTEQAAAAKRYLDLSHELKARDIAFVRQRVTQQMRLVASLDETLTALEVTKAEEEEAQRAIKADYEAADATLVTLDESLDRLRQTFDRLSAERATEVAAKSRADAASEHACQESARLVRERATLASDMAADRAAEATQRDEAKALAAKDEAIAQALESARAALKEAQDKASEAERARAALDDARAKVTADRLTLETRRAALVSEANAAHEALKRAEAEQVARAKAEQTGRAQLDSATAALQALKDEETKVKARYDAATRAWEALATQLTQAMEARHAADGAWTQARDRLAWLIDLERHGEGYAAVVKRLLQRREADDALASGLLGPVASLIEVDDGFETAVETALGGAKNHIVVTHEAVASKAIAWLKASRGGRATFLPLDTIQPWPLDPDVLRRVDGAAGLLGTAEGHVRAEARLAPVLSRLLGRTLVVDTLEHALVLFARLNRRVHLVTLEGEHLAPGGAITGGREASAITGVFQRHNERRALEARCQALSSARDDAEANLSARLRDQEAEKARLAADEADLNAASKRVDEATFALDRICAEATQATHAAQEAERRRAALERALGDAQEALSHLMADDESLTAREETLAREHALLPERDRAQRERIDALASRVSDLRVAASEVSEARRANARADEALRRRRTANESRLAALDEAHRASEATHTSARDTSLTCGEAIEAIDAKLKTIKNDVERMTAERSGVVARQRAAVAALEASAERRGRTTLEMEKITNKKVRAQSVIDEAKARLWSRYECVYDELEADDGANQTVTARDIDALEAEIHALGPINPNAIAERETVGQRLDALVAQRDDMEASRHALTRVIHDLDRDMKATFNEAFRAINTSFGVVFRELFNGGDAYLELADDSDALDSDIIIHAQPPGKRMQTLNPLSGGERALTAIALLFAIMRRHPSPFCVFDEIEAALDDTNVVRFADYVRRYAHATQFVLVTHRKGTMACADRLYGVTMQERGVSRILTMQLTEAKAIRS